MTGREVFERNYGIGDTLHHGAFVKFARSCEQEVKDLLAKMMPHQITTPLCSKVQMHFTQTDGNGRNCRFFSRLSQTFPVTNLNFKPAFTGPQSYVASAFPLNWRGKIFKQHEKNDNDCFSDNI